jgi:phosphoglycolate phosphatase
MLKDATIVFDLDGTLVDTAPDLTEALNHVLRRRGHDAVSAETIRAAVSHGARVMIEEGLRRLQAEDDIEQMLAEFLIHYEANIAAKSRPFPGAKRALEWLASKGAKLAVCTNKREHLSRKLLQALQFDRYFHAIAGRDTFAVSKPNPAHLTGAIALAGGRPDIAVMVGDSHIDYMTAEAARIPIVLVSFGYGPPLPKGAYADCMIDHFSELKPRVDWLVGERFRRVQNA